MKIKSKKNIKNNRKHSRKNVRKNKRSRKNVSKYSRKNVSKYSRKNVMRGGVLSKEDLSIIERLRKNDPTLTTLNKYEGAYEYLMEIIEALKTNTNLKVLNIVDNLSEYRSEDYYIIDKKVLELIEALTKALKVNTTLTNLKFNYTIMRRVNVLSAEQISIIERLRNNNGRQLDTLDLHQGGYVYLIEIIKALETNTTLKELNISHNNLTDDFIKLFSLVLALTDALKVNTTLTTLNFNKNNLYNAGLEKLADALKENTTLTTLNISESYGYDGMTGYGGEITSYSYNGSVKRNPTKNGDAGATAIATALVKNTTLKELDISKNLINTTGLTNLSKALNINTSLETLVINHNIHDSKNLNNDAYAILLNNNTLKKLDISNNKIGNLENGIIHTLKIGTGSQTIAKALKTNTTLTTLNISSNKIDNDGATAIATALEKNTTLKELDISKNLINTTGLKDLSKALKNNKSLETLVINHNIHDSKNLNNDAYANLLNNNTLKKLDISNNQIGDLKNGIVHTLKIGTGAQAIGEALKTNTTLTTLDISSNKIGNDGATAIATALKDNTTLTELNISRNKIGDDGAQAIASSLETNKHIALTTLSIYNNNIGDAGAQAIAKALTPIEDVYSPTLTTLNIGNNNFSIEGLTALAKALKKNITLTTLYIGDNNIGDNGATVLATELGENNTLTELYINGNKIGDDGAKAISLQLIRKLKLLDLFYNNIGDVGAEAIAEALKFKIPLKELIMNHNKIGNAGAQAIAKALDSNKESFLIKLNIYNNEIKDDIQIEIETLIMRNRKKYEKYISNSKISNQLSTIQTLDSIFNDFISKGFELSEDYTKNQSMIKNSSNKKSTNLTGVKNFINSLELKMNNQTKKSIMKLKNTDEGIKTTKAIIFNLPLYIFLEENKEFDKTKVIDEYRKYIESIINKKMSSRYTNYTTTPNDGLEVIPNIPNLPADMWNLILSFLDINITKNLLDSFRLPVQSVISESKV